MPKIDKVTLGAGCFWGTQKFFAQKFKDSIISSKVGYTGGNLKTPTYHQVCRGDTGHAEVLQLEYDTEKAKYEDFIHFFFRMHDPTTLNRQGNDMGTQYRSAVFYHNEEQKQKAMMVMEKVKSKFIKPIVTTLEPASEFFEAEDYHQQYLEKNPGGYCNHKLYW